MATKKKTDEPAPVMLGFKRICPGCGTRYYDRGLVPPVCPSCSAEFNPDALLKNRRSRIIEDEKAAPAADVDDEELLDEEEEDAALKVLGDDELDEDEEADDSLIEDTSELGEDDEDIIEIEDTDEEEDQ